MTDFEAYVTRYSHGLSKFCIKLCGGIDDADDLFQDTWTRALEHFDAYDPEKSFQTWLFTICVNLYRNAGKSKYNTTRREFSSTEEKQRFFDTVPAEEQDIDERLDLYRALNSLPKKYRVVLSLFYLRAFTTREIAEILHIPEGTVGSRLHTAKKLLKRRLQDGSHDR
ncbi:MAG: sigma-70 family RNA polymerase sigma factor [Ruminococcus sp.]|nr:sigma-70 family RNA polymerase sigma factor [Ruminococcus sp.]